MSAINSNGSAKRMCACVCVRVHVCTLGERKRDKISIQPRLNITIKEGNAEKEELV